MGVISEIVEEIQKFGTSITDIKNAITAKGVISQGKSPLFAAEIAQIATADSEDKKVVNAIIAKRYPGLSRKPYNINYINYYISNFVLAAAKDITKYEDNKFKVAETKIHEGKVVINYTKKDNSTGTVTLTKNNLVSEVIPDVTKYTLYYEDEYGNNTGTNTVEVNEDLIEKLYGNEPHYTPNSDNIKECYFDKLGSSWGLIVNIDKTPDNRSSVFIDAVKPYLDKLNAYSAKEISKALPIGLIMYLQQDNSSQYFNNIGFFSFNYGDKFNIILYYNSDIKRDTAITFRLDNQNIKVVNRWNVILDVFPNENCTVTLKTDGTVTKVTE